MSNDFRSVLGIRLVPAAYYRFPSSFLSTAVCLARLIFSLSMSSQFIRWREGLEPAQEFSFSEASRRMGAVCRLSFTLAGCFDGRRLFAL